MTDKQIIKLRPICLYEDTCLFLKEKTRLCEDCVHHKNFWSELLEKEQAEKIKSLKQECEKLYIQLKADEEYHKEEENTLRKIIKNKEERNIELYKENNKLKQTLTEIKDYCNKYPQNSIGFKKYILQKISEFEVKK